MRNISKIFGFNFAALTLSMLLLFSCAKEANNGANSQSEEGIKTTISFEIGELETFTTDTRAIDWEVPTASEYEFSTAIKNLVVIQFNGTDPTSVVNNVQYIDDLEDGKVELLTTYGSTLIVFVANTFDSEIVTKDLTTLETFQKAGYSLSGDLETTESGIFYDKDLFHSDSDGNKYFTMSGYLHYDELTAGGEETVKLMRNVAKVSFRVENDWSQDDSTAEITKVSLMSVPATSNYYVNREDADETTDLLIPVTVSSTLSYSNSVSIEKGDSEIFTYYVPTNMRGTITNIYDTQSEKANSENVPDGATYVSVRLTKTVFEAETETETEAEIETGYIYMFYLGDNLIDDYNLKFNHQYAYDFTFTGNGLDEVDTDYRITELATVTVGDYTQCKSSNCYILNPSATKDIVYYIPIAPRINEYWGGVDYANEGNKINDSELETWDYSVLWYDNDSNPTSTSGNSIEFDKVLRGEDNTTPSLKITLPAWFDGNHGNILVAVKDNDGVILWSWHLWITDYNPYNHGLTSTVAGAYSLDNGTGNLHRYQEASTNGTTVWSTIYKDKYMMDRNIGARSAVPTDDKGILYYQYGRKDPFRYSTSDSYTNSTSSTTMSNSIKAPTTYNGNGGDWCSSDSKFNETIASITAGRLWRDPNCFEDTGEKSIFDPSPYGFRLPVYDVWVNFNSAYIGLFTSSGASGSAGYGFNYKIANDYPTFYYPACGYISNAGKKDLIWSYVVNGCASPYLHSNAATHCRAFLIYTSIQRYIYLSSGTTLRCIEDVDEVVD